MDSTLRQQVSELHRSELLTEAVERRMASQFPRPRAARFYVAQLLLRWGASLSGDSRPTPPSSPNGCQPRLRCNGIAVYLAHPSSGPDGLVSLTSPCPVRRRSTTV